MPPALRGGQHDHRGRASGSPAAGPERGRGPDHTGGRRGVGPPVRRARRGLADRGRPSGRRRRSSVPCWSCCGLSPALPSPRVGRPAGWDPSCCSVPRSEAPVRWPAPSVRTGHRRVPQRWPSTSPCGCRRRCYRPLPCTSSWRCRPGSSGPTVGGGSSEPCMSGPWPSGWPCWRTAPISRSGPSCSSGSSRWAVAWPAPTLATRRPGPRTAAACSGWAGRWPSVPRPCWS